MIKEEIKVPIEKGSLPGNLIIPEDALGLVLFSHGSGSSRFSPRNNYVANVFNENKMATLLIDLLTLEEDEVDRRTREFRFDISLLSERLLKITDWLEKDKRTKNLNIAYIGSSTGAASALIAAAQKGRAVRSIVSRGGRPDLAADFLLKVVSPTLLIIGGEDAPIIEMNQQAFALLSCEKRIEIVPGATHLFEEPGTLEEAARLASTWLKSRF